MKYSRENEQEAMSDILKTGTLILMLNEYFPAEKKLF